MRCVLTGLPDAMKPELLLLIPSMVDTAEHNSAAEELLKCLSGEADARFPLDASLRLHASVALSMLRLNGGELIDRVLSVFLTVRTLQ